MRCTRMTLTALMTMALGLPACSTTRDVHGPDTSDFLLNISGSYNLTDREFEEETAEDDGDDATKEETIGGQINLGYFLSPNHEIGALTFGSLTRFENGGDTSALFFGPYYNFNFHATETLSFYVGPHVGWTRFDAENADATELSYGAHAGMRLWVSPHTSLTIEPRFTITDFDDEIGGETTNFDVLFGLSVIL